MIYLAEDAELVFPALASVANSSDVQDYLQLLGEKATLDHQFGANPDFDWLETGSGVTILDGFGAYVLVDGDDALVAASTDAHIFQNSKLLDLEISGGKTNLIFDPTAQQTMNITLTGGELTLHASTPSIFAVNTTVDGDTKVINVGDATIYIEGEGGLSLTDLASDTPILLDFPELEVDGEAGVDVVVEDEIGPDTRQAAKTTSATTQPEASAYVIDDDFYLSYNNIESVVPPQAELHEFTREGLDAANNILSVMPFTESDIDTLEEFDAEISELQEDNEIFVDTITVTEQIADLIFDDGTEIYWGL